MSEAVAEQVDERADDGVIYRPTERQQEAIRLLGSDATHVLLYGGSRSGKTFLLVRAIVIRALAAPHSRHAILRFRFNHVKQSIAFDTFPKVMRLCFPQVKYHMDRTDWYVRMPNGSTIWFGGLDDKERTEKILGQEYVTIFMNECSQIPFSSRNIAMTRLAQKVEAHLVRGSSPAGRQLMRRKCYYDENPPSQGHWSYRQFIRKVDPETGRALKDPENYAAMQVNPQDNLENLPPEYLKTLESLPARMRTRFLQGRFADLTEGAYWNAEDIEKWRAIGDELPDMQRIVIGVDPSGADDDENLGNEEIGIIVAGLGVDGNAYVLEDLSVKAGPRTWGNVVASAFDRHLADKVIGEINYGGAMVEHVVQTARPRTPFEAVTASRGKAVRAEPISALAEQGKIRHAGTFMALEEELCSFTKAGYVGTGSPNRGDAYVWAMTSLFPALTRRERKEEIAAAQTTVQLIGSYTREEAAQSWLGT